MTTTTVATPTRNTIGIFILAWALMLLAALLFVIVAAIRHANPAPASERVTFPTMTVEVTR